MTEDFRRSFPLLDINVRSGGDGRTVEAYAAVWNTPTDIADGHGRYREQIAPSAFDRTTSHRQNFPVMFNHGMTMYGTPSDKWSAPVGVTSEVRADTRGLVSVWRADPTQGGDEALAMIQSGSVRGQSFQGRFVTSSPDKPRGGYGPDKRTGELTLVTRSEIALTELGPTPFPAYAEATISAVRAEEFVALMDGISDEERAELRALLLAYVTPRDGEGSTRSDTPDDSGPVAEDPPEQGTPVGSVNIRHLRRMAREKGVL